MSVRQLTGSAIALLVCLVFSVAAYGQATAALQVQPITRGAVDVEDREPDQIDAFQASFTVGPRVVPFRPTMDQAEYLRLKFNVVPQQ